MDPILLLIIVIALAVLFDFSNGFNDAANAIATSIGTRVLTPRAAILLATSLNIAGALVGTAVAITVAEKIVDPTFVTQATLIAALISATLWNMVATHFGIPVSASHALLASLLGAGLASGGVAAIKWANIVQIFWAIVLSPILGFAAALLLIVVLTLVFRKSSMAFVGGLFRRAQILSAAYMAFSHGSNDAQKTMGVITLALFSGGYLTDLMVPLWVKLLAASAMGMGTALGGWRVIRTLGMRLTSLKPVQGFAAEASAASVIWANSMLGLPISTTHVISAAVLGVGASKRLSAVRWGIGIKIVFTWVLTIPACAVISFIIAGILATL